MLCHTLSLSMVSSCSSFVGKVWCSWLLWVCGVFCFVAYIVLWTFGLDVWSGFLGAFACVCNSL
jgi:hypothetical protein